LEKTIREQIEFLKGLQVIDKEIYLLEQDKKSIPEKISGIDRALENKRTGLKSEEDNLKKIQVKLKDCEISLQQKEEQIKKLQGQLYQLKTNKEYSTMQNEIEGIKADSSIIEENMIIAMDEVEIVKKRIAEEKELFKKEEIESRNQKDIINLRVKEIDSRLSTLFFEREKIVPSIDKQVKMKYEMILKNRGGIAIVPVEDGVCGGCHMNLPPQIINEAKIKEEVVLCNNCSRILYIDDNIELN
jgi:uncharacterized protein